LQTILLLKSAFLCVFRFFGLSSFDIVTTLILSCLASFLPFFEVIPEIYYNFANSSTKTCTITVISSTWNSNNWYTQLHGMVGFSPNPTLITDNLTVNYGETVTVYAKGDEGNHDSDYGTESWWYYIKGFYNSDHVIYKASNGDINTTNDTYTFKATENRTIYVDFIYYKR